MANIVSSSIVFSRTQRDGSLRVREDHIDLNGKHWARLYETPAGTDLSAELAAYAVALGNELRDGEIASNINDIINNGRFAVPSLSYSNGSQNAAALRLVYQTALRVEAIFMADYLNTLTDNQIANAFNITTQQAQTLRSNKLSPAASLADSIRATTGA